TSSRRLPLFILSVFAGFILAVLPLKVFGGAQPENTQLSGLRWRLIGPFRAGRVTAVAGVPGDPSTFYFGTPGGGIWKTVDGGQVWRPVFDKERVASIGALAVAPSDPHVIYAGTGEQTRGHGLFRSFDGGATWQSAGLKDVLFIQAIVVDPHDPNVAVVAGNSVGMGILWHPLPRWAYTADRGIFKTTDGGKSWKKVFTNDDTLGIVDMCSDPGDPRRLYAVVYRAASGSGDSRVEATSDIIKSSDEGTTWTPLKTKGLPDKARKRMGIAVAPGNGGRRLYAILDQGFFRSDDAGATWRQSTKDPRVLGSAYFSRVFVDPNHPDVLYVAQTSLYRSMDGGRTFEAYVGAPSGDDFHVLWIDPRDSQRMILGVDQGAIISVNGGRTWSSWYNQPTGQFYHVSTDNLFPYRVYGAQQDSGTAGVLSRSDYGQILAQDWYSVGGFEYAFITPDPAHPNLVYSGGWYGSVVRFDRSTGQIATVFEDGQKYRSAQMPPLVFSPQDASVLYLGTQYVLKTADGGVSWQPISPDLTGYVEKPEAEGKADPGRPKPPAITALSPSVAQSGEIWAGTSNRLVYLTRDAGANWQNVTPAGLDERTQVLYVEASHHDPATAYLTVGATRESTPAYVARTHDYGKTWQKIVNGFPADEMVRVVREDPRRKGLLYAGTDTGVFVSWDDGDHWQSLSLNLPATPVTDIQVHGNDLAISTFGRGLWIMDDVTPLRDIKPEITASGVYLFPPATGMRVRWDNYQDTPYPIETPAGQNPPDGAMIDYFLKTPAKGALSLTIFDEKGAQVASFSSDQEPPRHLPANVPSYWFAPPTVPSTRAGVNRFVWDLRYPAPASLPYSYYGELLEYSEYTLADHAIPGLTPRQQPRGPLVAPGKYTVEVRYGGQTLRQPLTVKLDPRVHASQQDLVEQRDLALEIVQGMKSSYDTYQQVAALRKALTERQKAVHGGAKTNDALKNLENKIAAVEKGTKTAPGFGPVNRDLGRLIFSVENADVRPSQSVRAAVDETCEALNKDLLQWRQINEQDVKSLNEAGAKSGSSRLPIVSDMGRGCK
ncbi:MAG TPA: hypothetical protein VLT16_09485, partial [Candidatus Limnocylindrales bacterium]|nr:hypothetical protein [Candidatus Limnocylindrales bacterium]